MKKAAVQKPGAGSIDNSPVTPSGLEEKIRLRAYQLYEERGRQDGFAEQDWIQAEAELLRSASSLKAVA